MCLGVTREIKVSIDARMFAEWNPSDRLALYFRALLIGRNKVGFGSLLSELDAWILKLGPRFPLERVLPLLANCEGTPLEPMRLSDGAKMLATRFVSIILSEQVRGNNARVVSEDTLGCFGGLRFDSELRARFIPRFKMKAWSDSTKQDSYFAPAALCEEFPVATFIRPLAVVIQPSREKGFSLRLNVKGAAFLNWLSRGRGWSSSADRLARDLGRHSRFGKGICSLDNLCELGNPPDLH